MLDIDDFKAINDTYGHPAGDKALIYISKVLKETLPGQSVLGRRGKAVSVTIGEGDPPKT